MKRANRSTVTVGRSRLTIEDVIAIATAGDPVALPKAPAYRRRIRAGADFLRAELAAGRCVYGVNTGYGDNCTTAIPADLVAELPDNLIRYHGVGTGVALDAEATRAVLACRLNSLALGFSGVRLELLDQLVGLPDLSIAATVAEFELGLKPWSALVQRGYVGTANPWDC